MAKSFEIPSRVIYLSTFIIFIVTMVVVIPTPLRIEPSVQNCLTLVESQKNGIALYSCSLGFSQYESCGPTEVAMMRALAKNKVKMVFECFGAETPQYISKLLGVMNLEKAYGYVYGVDYVIMPYLAGEEVAFAKGTKLDEAYATDFYGTPKANIPLLQKVKTVADVNFIVFDYVTCTYPDMSIRQYWTAYGKTMIHLTNGCSTSIAPYVGKGVTGYIDGLGMGAELEFLINYPGGCMRMITPRSLQGVLIIGLVIIGNIIYFSTRKRVEEKEVKK